MFLAVVYMNKEESNKISKIFYENLRRQIRRYAPYDFAVMASNTLRASLSNMDLMSPYPPHFILHAIEANCHYFDPHVKKGFDRREFNKVMNIYHEYTEPYQQYELSKKNMEGLFNFLISMAMNQFPIQRHLNFNIFARSIVLFHESENMEYFRNLFTETYSLPIKDWLILAFAIFSWLSSNKTVVFQPENLFKSEVHLPVGSLKQFLNSTSLERKEISDNFDREINQFQQKYLRLFARSSFFDFPFIRFSNTYINPHPNLLSYLVHERIYKMLSDISFNEFQTAFGKTFEEYVDMLLNDLTDVRILREDEIKHEYNLSREEVCDFIIEFPDCLLLIEVKAVQYTKRILNIDLLISANSSKKIAKAHDQLFSICEAISPINKLAICVTFGQMYFPNLDIYYQNVIIPNMNSNIQEVKNLLVYPPQTFSIDEFEEFIAIIKFHKMSPIKLFDEMNNARSKEAQSWHTFLYNKYRSEIDSFKTILSKKYFEFFKEQGVIPPDFAYNKYENSEL